MFDLGHLSSKMHLRQLHMDTAKAGIMETGFKVTNSVSSIGYKYWFY